MTPLLQHLLVLVVVAVCVAVIARQTLATLFGRGGRIGQCCAKGCAAHLDAAKRSGVSETPAKSQAAAAGGPKGERVVFLPVEMLTRKR